MLRHMRELLKLLESSDHSRTHTAWIKGSKEIVGVMLMTMEPDIQRNLETLHAHGMLLELKTLFANKEFDGFVKNYNMHSLSKTINELHAMLKLHEQTLPKNNVRALHAIRAGHCKRNYPQYLAELLKKKKNAASGAGGSDGFINSFVNNIIQVSMNNMVYFSAIPRDGIFEIDLSNSYTNESSIYVVSNKRAMLDLDSALLWHFRLGHISKKRIEKLQHNGLIDSTDLRAFEKCVSYMSGKMIRKPYTHQVERAKDLLGLIHIDVCSPFKIMLRQGASYFVTFTDDFSRYGYVYLLKHKIEVFQTFKVFQKKVENQLSKTNKSLRSNREGEYMSQEFLDHLKDHGIIAHHTPPYTPQHNGVSEKRNRTLLDMVRSVMSQTTLSKSFWDYALETAARILNMVPTKKVEKTPYEETMRYSFYYPPEKKILVARNAKFLENSLITQEASRSLEDLEIIQEEDTHPSIDTSLNHEEDDLEINEPQSDIVSIRRSIRTRHAPDLELPPNGKTVGSKWLFKKKIDMDGVVHNYKARLVAKGYTQTLEIDYDETFSPVAGIRAIRILIAIYAYYDYEI
nr:hypothetical protein [Tanacetum cinerariifolium]